MIVFALNCKNCNFQFEGWFESSAEYTKQNKKNLIQCPSCESNQISKGLMTPNISSKVIPKQKKLKKLLLQIFLD